MTRAFYIIMQYQGDLMFKKNTAKIIHFCNTCLRKEMALL